MRKLSRPLQHKQGRQRDLSRALVDSTERAETLAEYLEKVHWSEQFTEILVRSTRMFDTVLVMNLNAFNVAELQVAIANFKRNKASGGDAIPMEFWKALMAN